MFGNIRHLANLTAENLQSFLGVAAARGLWVGRAGAIPVAHGLLWISKVGVDGSKVVERIDVIGVEFEQSFRFVNRPLLVAGFVEGASEF
jgi:hypothetical protein